MTSWLETLEPLSGTAAALFGRNASCRTSRLTSPDLQAEAESVLAAAHAEADELIEDAKTQAEALREAAWQEGFHQGKVEAHTTVEAEMRTAWAARQEALRAEMDLIAADIATAREALWMRQESEMVALALDIARQVIKTEVTQNPAAVHAVIANALRRITDKEQCSGARFCLGCAARQRSPRRPDGDRGRPALH